jgi:class 3 adenylate cyclase
MMFLATTLSMVWYFSNWNTFNTLADLNTKTLQKYGEVYQESEIVALNTLSDETLIVTKLVRDSFLNIPRSAATLNTDAISQSVENNLRYLWPQIRHQFPNLHGVFYGDRAGTFAGFHRTSRDLKAKGEDDLYTVEYRAADSNTSSVDCKTMCPPAPTIGHTYVYEVSGSSGVFLPGKDPIASRRYETFKDMWYQIATRSPGHPVWTPIYAVGGVLGVSAVQSHVVDGEVQVVSGAYTTLDSLSKFLRNLVQDRGGGGRIFIIDGEDYMVASSSQEHNTYAGQQASLQQLPYQDIKDPMVDSAMSVIIRQRMRTRAEVHPPETAAQLRGVYVDENAGYVISFKSLCMKQTAEMEQHQFKNKFLRRVFKRHVYCSRLHRWLIVNVQLKSSYKIGLNCSMAQLRGSIERRTQELNDQTRQQIPFLIGVSSAIVLVGAVVSGCVTRRVTRPLIRTVKHGTRAVANLDFDRLDQVLNGSEQGILQTSKIREVTELRESFGQLSNGLRSFAKYMDPYVVQLLVQSQRQATLGVAKADVTVFFSDIADFTTIAEELDPNEFMELFSVYLEEMSRIIMDCSGVVGEFIGDCIMAWWNVPVQVGEFHTRVALTAALLQQIKLAELRGSWLQKGLPTVHSRMGLVKGEVLAGNIGSTQRMKYGLVGDSVNLASRLEGLCGRYGVSILVDQTAKNAPGVEQEFFLRPIDLVTVKGRSHPTELFEVVASQSEGAISPSMGHGMCQRYCDDFHKIHTLYRGRQFQAALGALEEYVGLFPNDKAAQIMKARCEVLIGTPPGDDWTPVEKLNKKS